VRHHAPHAVIDTHHNWDSVDTSSSSRKSSSHKSKHSSILGSIGHGLKKAGKFAVDHRGLIATGLATAGCIVPGVGWALCAGFQAGAYAVRTQQNLADGGWEKNKKKIIVDGVITTITAGMSGPWRLAQYGKLGNIKGAPLIPFGSRAKSFMTEGWNSFNKSVPLAGFTTRGLSTTLPGMTANYAAGHSG
jgi:hypothetical protein